jgi:hypothetical protein
MIQYFCFGMCGIRNNQVCTIGFRHRFVICCLVIFQLAAAQSVYPTASPNASDSKDHFLPALSIFGIIAGGIAAVFILPCFLAHYFTSKSVPRTHKEAFDADPLFLQHPPTSLPSLSTEFSMRENNEFEDVWFNEEKEVNAETRAGVAVGGFDPNWFEEKPDNIELVDSTFASSESNELITKKAATVGGYSLAWFDEEGNI